MPDGSWWAFMADSKCQYHVWHCQVPNGKSGLKWIRHYRGVPQVGGQYSGVSPVVTHPQKR
eukprot:7106961-Prorocentrum_lima.AAC.1